MHFSFFILSTPSKVVFWLCVRNTFYWLHCKSVYFLCIPQIFLDLFSLTVSWNYLFRIFAIPLCMPMTSIVNIPWWCSKGSLGTALVSQDVIENSLLLLQRNFQLRIRYSKMARSRKIFLHVCKGSRNEPQEATRSSPVFCKVIFVRVF